MYDINDSGAVLASLDGTTHGVCIIERQGIRTFPAALLPYEWIGYGFINNDGVAVFTADEAARTRLGGLRRTGRVHVYRLSKGRLAKLPDGYGGFDCSVVLGMNEAGDAWGNLIPESHGSGSLSPPEAPVIWTAKDELMVVKVPKNTQATVFWVNSPDLFVGHGTMGARQLPILWKDGEPEFLPVPDGCSMSPWLLPDGRIVGTGGKGGTDGYLFEEKKWVPLRERIAGFPKNARIREIRDVASNGALLVELSGDATRHAMIVPVEKERSSAKAGG